MEAFERLKDFKSRTRNGSYIPDTSPEARQSLIDGGIDKLFMYPKLLLPSFLNIYYDFGKEAFDYACIKLREKTHPDMPANYTQTIIDRAKYIIEANKPKPFDMPQIFEEDINIEETYESNVFKEAKVGLEQLIGRKLKPSDEMFKILKDYTETKEHNNDAGALMGFVLLTINGGG